MDHDDFDRFVQPLDYPMYVLTVAGGADARPSGCLVGFATQCSITPPLFLAGLSKRNHTYRAAAGVDTVALHLLGAGDRDLAELFGAQTGDEVDKFAHCAWTEGPHGVPLLRRCSAWFVGRILDRLDLGGDHEGLVLRPTHVSDEARAPALMFSAVRQLEAGHSS